MNGKNKNYYEPENIKNFNNLIQYIIIEKKLENKIWELNRFERPDFLIVLEESELTKNEKGINIIPEKHSYDYLIILSSFLKWKEEVMKKYVEDAEDKKDSNDEFFSIISSIEDKLNSLEKYQTTNDYQIEIKSPFDRTFWIPFIYWFFVYLSTCLNSLLLVLFLLFKIVCFLELLHLIFWKRSLFPLSELWEWYYFGRISTFLLSILLMSLLYGLLYLIHWILNTFFNYLLIFLGMIVISSIINNIQDFVENYHLKYSKNSEWYKPSEINIREYLNYKKMIDLNNYGVLSGKLMRDIWWRKKNKKWFLTMEIFDIL